MFQSPESDYANLQQLSVGGSDPVNHDDPVPGAQTGIFNKKLNDDWAMYTDPVSHRPYYVNTTTNVTQWKPPRGDYHREKEQKVR